jgi:hypothetical protein
MPDRDMTGKLVQDSIKIMSRLRGRMDERIPYGPLRKNLTSKEARLLMQEMDPQEKHSLIQKVGDEEWRRMMEDLYGN